MAIQGTVTDVYGDPVEGVEVIAIDTETGMGIDSVETDANGQYSIPVEENHEAHVMVQHDDGQQLFHDYSKPYVDAGPEQYFTDFTEYSLGTDPTDEDWSLRWEGNMVPQVVENQGERALEIAKGVADRTALSWDEPPMTASDVEIYMKMEVVSGSDTRGALRGRGEAGNETAHTHGYRSTHSHQRLSWYDEGAYGELKTYSDAGIGMMKQRVYAEGQEVGSKLWPADEDEPGYYHTAGQAPSAPSGSGWVGVFSFTAETWYLHEFGVGVNGQPAPTSPV